MALDEKSLGFTISLWNSQQLCEISMEILSAFGGTEQLTNRQKTSKYKENVPQAFEDADFVRSEKQRLKVPVETLC